MVLHHRIGLEDVRPNLRTPGYLRKVPFDFLQIFLVLLLRKIHQFGHQYLHGDFTILVLASLILTGDDDVGRNVGDTDGRIGFVDVLAAGPAAAVGVYADVIGIDIRLPAALNGEIRTSRWTPCSCFR